MCVQILDALCLLSRSPAFTFPGGRLTVHSRETRRPWICPRFYFDNGRYEGESFLVFEGGGGLVCFFVFVFVLFYILKMVLCREGPVSLPHPLLFQNPVGGKIDDVHGGNLWPLVLCPVFGLMFLS